MAPPDKSSTNGLASYASLRAAVDGASSSDGATLSRVEVNQRALIDKILARYASPGAVYRELLQNSNDAEADTAELRFDTGSVAGDAAASSQSSSSSSSSSSPRLVHQVVYRNNGMPFRPQDWSRLQKIAEGNPDVSKVGAFGVGAYTMFSISEEPMVLSGNETLVFVWKGDALWTKTARRNEKSDAASDPWTSFVLPSRDPYPLPDLVELGQFLAASLTFTGCLRQVRVLVDDTERLCIVKTPLQEPRPVEVPKNKASGGAIASWWSGRHESAAAATTSRGVFSLKGSGALLESVQRITVFVTPPTGKGRAPEAASLDARYISAVAQTHIPSDMARRMERVTKKPPPPHVTVQVFLNAQQPGNAAAPKTRTEAERILSSFSPPPGKGRIFIGFRTSQTTGLAAHVAAPFVPTVEREAMDLQDPTLRLYNSELLELAGQLMRLTLEDAMHRVIGAEWHRNAAQREKLERELLAGATARPPSNAGLTAAHDGSDEEPDDATATSSSGLLGFARFMARGVKKKIVSVVNTVEGLVDDGAEYLRPVDPLPLSEEEEQAVVLMQSFCPQQSTPDPLVGTCLAQGFSRCLPDTAPPVLTRSGVVPSHLARLPHQGIESFVRDNVVRSVVYRNAEEYHTVIAPCQTLNLQDLVQALQSTVLESDRLVFLLRWWVRYCRVDPRGARLHGPAIKEAVRFYAGPTQPGGAERTTVALRNILFYVDRTSVLSKTSLPLPETVLAPALQARIGDLVLTDPALEPWFNALPIEVWADFVSHHSSMVETKAEHHRLRLKVLGALCKEFSLRSHAERAALGGFLATLLSNARCIPCEADGSTAPAADRPSELYLRSAELAAFAGIGLFRKVSPDLHDEGVTEEFLLALGVRKSVAIDFLFSSLDSLKWSNDPKPLIEYLRSATLTNEDLAKLSRTQYLPAENDDRRTFAPSELYLPNLELRVFSFPRFLRWPSESEVPERSKNGAFLVKLGIQTIPSLSTVLAYTTNEVADGKKRLLCLDFIADRLGPKGVYHESYLSMNPSIKNQYRCLPCVRMNALESSELVTEVQSPLSCYSDKACIVMGLPVLDYRLGDRAKLYGSLFQCQSQPHPDLLLRQLLQIVAAAKKKHAANKQDASTARKIVQTFSEVFGYLSHRSSDFGSSSLDTLRRESFIPCIKDIGLDWVRADQVFFRSSQEQRDLFTEELFQVVDFSPFLATVGVKQEATTKDLFQLMVTSPQAVLDSLGGSEAKYRTLLRRIAANPPFSKVTDEIKNSQFLLAYTVTYQDSGSPESGTFELARAQDVYVIDNSFFGRMFPVKRAPHESDLEDFYVELGSNYISKSVERRFEVVGKPSSDTSLSTALKKRILERSPLLVSPSITSRPLASNASALLSDSRLTILEASKLMAVYSLKGVSKRNATTCFSRALSRSVNAIYVVSDFDWFDVGYAVGDLILKRCQLEDAFFISSLLEAPVEQLRARGFPVDRIIKTKPPVPPPRPPSPPPAQKPEPPAAIAPTAASSASVTTPNDSKGHESTSVAAPQFPEGAVRETESAQDAQNAPDQQNSDPGYNMSKDGFVEILRQMYPSVDPSYIQKRLGNEPVLDDVQRIAEELAASTQVPRDDPDSATSTTNSTRDVDEDASQLLKRNKGGFRKKLGRAFNGLRGSSFGGATVGGSGLPQPVVETRKRAPNVSDAESHNHLEAMLQNAVKSASQVNAQGVHSHETTLTSIPEGLDRGDTCELLPGHSLQPFAGPRGTFKSHNGIRLFSSRGVLESEEFLNQNQKVVDSFSLVVERLCSIYNLPLTKVAIFHDPSGQTIAFNSNRALHFNVRFYHALHFQANRALSSECYSYWFVTMAHELAHNLASGHNKEHGFYTESYVTMYLPKLLALIGSSNAGGNRSANAT